MDLKPQNILISEDLQIKASSICIKLLVA